jgi:hypothetical protein
MEEIGSRTQPSAPQDLRGVALPGVGLAVETDEAAKKQNGEANIRIDAE